MTNLNSTSEDLCDSYQDILITCASINIRDESGNTLLHRASILGYAELIELILTNYNIAIDIKNNDGNSPINLASIHNHLDVIKILASHGAYIDTKNNHYMTPLNHAFQNKNTSVCEYLIESCGANYRNIFPVENDHFELNYLV